jgi:DNA polymerase
MNQLSLFSDAVMNSLEMPACHLCKLDQQCHSPKMPVYGEGRRKILLVGEAPGETEDRLGRPFVGKSGDRLRSTLADLSVDMDRDCWRYNAVICRPPDNKLPTQAIDHCRPNLLTTLKELEPEIVILLGGSAVKSLIGRLWKDPVGAIGRWVGWQIPCREFNCWVCPTYHPSYVERTWQEKVVPLWFSRHLAASVALSGHPFENTAAVPPDDVHVVYGQAEACGVISEIEQRGLPVAYDIETDRIKPDHPDSRIVCAGISDGITTAAFPWHGQVIKAFQCFLRSNQPKIGANLSFENRWAMKEFGKPVRNWVWDVVNMAHLLDNRADITSLKFQAFVRLGVGDYSSHIAPYLKSVGGGGNTKNRIDEVDLGELMHYCGLDALYTVQVAKLQMKEMG